MDAQVNSKIGRAVNSHAKNTDLEALRCIAIVYTVLAHTWDVFWPKYIAVALSQFSNFGSGVDLFFCISGFIITSSLKTNLPAKRNWSGFVKFAIPFWIKRFWRLAPASWTWIAVTVVLAATFSGVGGFQSLWANYTDALSALTQTANFRFAECRPTNSCGNMGIYWSLSLEEQFYLIFPFLLFFLPAKRLAYAMLIIIAAQFFIPRSVVTPLWSFRTEAIAVGVLLGIWKGSATYEMMRPRALQNRWVAVPVMVILAGLLAAISRNDQVVFFTIGLVALIAGAIVWIASYDSGYVLPRGLLGRLVLAIGERSYVIYLVHFPMIFVTFVIDSHFQGIRHEITLKSLIFLTLTVSCTEITHRFIEKPLRGSGRKYADAFSQRTAVGA